MQVYVAKTFELEEAVYALDYLANGHVHGKVVLHISEEAVRASIQNQAWHPCRAKNTS